jgi:tetratricopeptide (TPR) repeat protein
LSQRPGPFDLGKSFNEALTLQRAGRLREAEKVYARVLKAAPEHFDTLNLLGMVKAQLGQMGEAQRLFSTAVKINPRMPQAWANLGQALYALKRNADALASLDKARALAPGDVDILNHHANVLLSLERPREALAEFQEVLARAPNHTEARINCGLAHAALGVPDEALAEFDRALSITPGHPVAHYNRGLALFALGRYADAVAAHDAVVAVVPQHAGAWLNRGRALAALNRYQAALESYAKAEAARKDYADAEFMTALALLTLGDYARGFAKYEARWRRTGMPAQKSRGRPLWLGQYPLARKTILLHAEQGLGDTILFARYVPLLADAGAKVVIEVPADLKPLLASLKGAAAVIAPGEAPPPYDAHCPLGSLPLTLKTELATVPLQVPYLGADDTHLAKWSARLGEKIRPRIALAWSGNPDHLNDRNRSIAFAHLAPLLSAAAQFVSIQRDLRDEDAEKLAGESRVLHFGGVLEDFGDTAAVIALSDLVITVDTAVANLAGAMGRPVWVLVPFAPDWRWTLDGQTSPWFPTARLFRQTALGDWDAVIARLYLALEQFVST